MVDWEDIEYKYDDNVFEKCPYCDYEDEGCWEHMGEDGDEIEVVCSMCKNKYIMITNIKVTYTTVRIEGDNDE